jgi:hypothetical protein
MNYSFGHERHPDFEECAIPLGVPCEWCEEVFIEEDNGFAIPHIEEHIVRLGFYHRECHIRQVIGSVAHQLKTCHCFIPGASELDPPELTIRQAARLALELFEKENGYES